MTINVLFLCPHAAAKSVAAAGYLAGAADKLGLDLAISNAGTDPDPEVQEVVADRLDELGLPVAGTPRVVTDSDLERADVVINIGCDLGQKPMGEKVEPWSIPNFSDDPEAAFAAIEDHVRALAKQLGVDQRG